MDWLTFFAEIAKAASWPVAAVAIALIFREQLRDLLGRIKKGKVGPAEFEFEQRVRELETEAADLGLPPVSSPDSRPATAQASGDARSTVLRAWLHVEQAIDSLARKQKLFNALAGPGSLHTMNVLRKSGIVKEELVSLYRELRSLRNGAAHELDFSPSPESVVAFVRLAKELETALQALESAP